MKSARNTPRNAARDPANTTLAPHVNHQPMVNVMVEVERPSAEELAAYPRGERYRRLRANTEAQRNKLKGWLERQHLADEVMTLSPATGFNLLFIKCTPHAAQALAQAPGVVEVLFAGDGDDAPYKH